MKRMGDYRNDLHLSVCPSVCLSIRPSICPSFRYIFLSAPEPFERFSLNFGQMFASVIRCAEPISQPCQLKVMDLSLEFHVCSISPIPLEGISLNFGHMFASVRRCAELITQPCQHKVKVTVQGNSYEP